MSKPLLLVCPHCDAKNRLPKEKVGTAAQCGKCKASLFPNHPLELKGDRFQRHLRATDLPVLVDFWASWCAPCKRMAPIFAQANEKLKYQVRFVKLDTEQDPELARQYGIMSIPTLVLFQQGQEKARMSGVLDLGSLSGWLLQQGVNLYESP